MTKRLLSLIPRRPWCITADGVTTDTRFWSESKARVAAPHWNLLHAQQGSPRQFAAVRTGGAR
ncbi:hypothetical protein [Nocardioides campestrisoli]|uniref:hypothetical protein n=1 Tax=Nocardioides campestrisoli TaxID=2736757 RepID=UPI0015E7349E|nr:hypothetical protein [Nocardioides campestrisoli]